MSKKKTSVSLVRSSAAECLTFVAAGDTRCALIEADFVAELNGQFAESAKLRSAIQAKLKGLSDAF